MRVVPVPCLTDNYAYLVIAAGGVAAVVDASEAAPVREALRREGATLAAIWSTHHHWDHVGGNEELAREAGIEVVGHVSDRGRLPALTRAVDTGDTVGVGDVSATCIHIPGHTLGAVAYFIDAGVGARRLHRGHALLWGMRAALRGDARADARVALAARRAARRHARALRARVHGEQPALCGARRAVQRRCRAGPGARGVAARPRRARDRHDAARRARDQPVSQAGLQGDPRDARRSRRPPTT